MYTYTQFKALVANLKSQMPLYFITSNFTKYRSTEDKTTDAKKKKRTIARGLFWDVSPLGHISIADGR